MQRKLFSIIAVVAMLFAFGATAHAAYQCTVTLTAPGIIKQDCERVGSITFGFEADAVITAGDWWYADLPQTVTICDAINYVITGDDVANVLANTYDLSGGQEGLVLGGAATGIVNNYIGTNTGAAVVGPISISAEGGAAAADVAVTGAIVLQVTAAAGSQRIWIKAYGLAAGNDMTVPAGHTLNITILNGFAYQANIALDTDDGTGGAPDRIYGNAATLVEDQIPADNDANFPNPHVENTLCVNAESMSGSDMYVSYDSLDNFITFSGDSKIAHVVGTTTITLEACKGVTEGDFAYASQGACSFTYDDGTGYCDEDAFATQAEEWAPGSTGGQLLYLQSASTFGDPGDRYSVTLQISTPGCYFGSSPNSLAGMDTTEAVCDGDAGTAVSAWTTENEAGDTGVAYPDSSCSVDQDDRVRKVYTNTFTGIDGYQQLLIRLNDFVYDSSILGYGTEVSLNVTMSKYPCGDIVDEDIIIGTFVEECPEGGTSGSTLMFPFFPAMDGSMGSWWGGYAIVNGSGDDGTVDLTFTEATGATATLEDVAVAAGQMYFAATNAALLATLTADSGFGDENMSMVADCSFQMAAGFAFLGNTDEGTGYTALTNNTGFGD